MLTETGEVFSVQSDSIVVQVIQSSTCGGCSAQKGCGQGVLAKYLGSSQFIRVSTTKHSERSFRVGDKVELGVDELAMLKAAFLVYLVPLLTMIVGCLLYTSDAADE